MPRGTPITVAVRSSPRTAVVWAALTELLDERVPKAESGRLSVVDLGGGTGGFAVPLAALGHDVTVVDESPDALATLARRAAEHDVTVRAVQGDAGELHASVAAAVDLVLCHNVLEFVEDPAVTLAAVAEVLRPAGAVSVLAPNRTAAVVHRALGGRFAEARQVIDGDRGSWGEGDPMPRRFTLDQLNDLLVSAGFTPGSAHGVRVFTDLVPGGVAEGEAGGQAALLELEQVAAGHVELRSLATSLHVTGIHPS